MVSLLIIIASFLSAFLFDYLAEFNTFSVLISQQKESHKTLTNADLTDDEKQKMLLRSSGKIFLSAINLNVFIGIVCLPFIFLVFYIGPWMVKGINYFSYISSFKGIFISSSCFLLFYLIKKENQSTDYTLLQRFFHWVTLRSKIMLEMSYDINKNLHLKHTKAIHTDGKHVFITGLARSGTTALMNTLYTTKHYASLNYSDMPLLLAPNIWGTLSSKKTETELKERAHKDRIQVNNKSPEALDEVFWKTFLNNHYIQKESLSLNKITPEIMDEFEQYISLILLKNKGENSLRYLSKNNNNVLRIPFLLKKFPEASIIITFRSPLDHAASLLDQHRHFSEIHQADHFSLNYMNWLGHHEFGLNQKPFDLGNSKLLVKMNTYQKDDINYWLLIWLNYYSYVFKKFADTCIFVSYEQFCKAPKRTLGNLVKKIDLKDEKFDITAFKPTKRTIQNADKKILNDCQKIYDELMIKSI